MSESFTKLEQAQQHRFASHFFCVEGIRRIQITRYEIRVYKKKGLDWQPIVPKIEHAIKNIFPEATLCDFEQKTTENIRQFSQNNAVTQREVYEGVDIAQQNPDATRLFAIQGVERVIVDTDHIEVKISPAFDETTVWPDVEKTLLS